MVRPLLLAFSLLTTIPMPACSQKDSVADSVAMGRSVLFYPVVGGVIGAILIGVAWGLEGTEVGLRSALVLVTWVGLTGGLHLDGVADVADAWIGGMGCREKTLSILKDPRSGPAAITSLVLLLLVKWSALAALLATEEGEAALWMVPVVGRGGILLMLLTMPYVRQDGIGTRMARQMPKKTAWLLVLLLAVAASLWGEGVGISLLISLLFMIFLRFFVMRRVGGVTGDFLGAGCEGMEMVFLVSFVIVG